MAAKTQSDMVKMDLPPTGREQVRKVVVPGMQDLHTRSLSDITEVLATVLRMEPVITKFTWVIGKHFELTTE